MMFSHQPPGFRFRTAHAARRIVGGARSKRGRAGRHRAAVLVLYVVMNLGLPIGDFGPRAGIAQAAASNTCRCSPESRAAGRCCCAKPAAGAASRGCCAIKTATETKSCCAGRGTANPKTAPKRPAETNAAESTELAWTGGCPCGPINAPLVLICPQPRILLAAVTFDVASNEVPRPAATSDAPCGERARPFVPPPEFPIV